MAHVNGGVAFLVPVIIKAIEKLKKSYGENILPLTIEAFNQLKPEIKAPIIKLLKYVSEHPEVINTLNEKLKWTPPNELIQYIKTLK